MTCRPKMEPVCYETVVDTDEDDRRLAFLDKTVSRFGPVFNTIAPGTDLAGTPRRRAAGE